ncbi:MAG: hypothetical protein V1873_07280 [Verrucomicrobiota bacterium]
MNSAASNPPTAGAGTHPLRHPAVAWVLPLAVAVAWFVLWGMALEPLPPPRPAGAAAVPQVSFAPPPSGSATGDLAGAEAYRLWSSAVFSLPTPLGFSSPALTNAIGARPPLDVPEQAAVYLERVAARGLRSAAGLGASMQELAADSLTGFPVRLAEPPVFPSPGAGRGIQIELSAGLAGQQFQSAELPDDRRARGEKAWEATAFVDVDEDGAVRYAFLENPTPSEKLNALLVRTLLRWRMAPAPAARSGRVTLRWLGPPPAGSSPSTVTP